MSITMVNTMPEWQIRQLRKLNDLFSMRDFVMAAERVKKGEITEAELIRHFDVPLEGAPYIRRYIQTGERNNELILPPISIVSEVDETIEPSPMPKLLYAMTKATEARDRGHVYIRLDPNVTRQELNDFLNRYFKVIKEKLKLGQHSPNRPIRSSLRLKNKEHVYELSDSGMSAPDIAAETGIGYDNVRKILERRKRL